jgi:hypothetical protein
MKKKTKALAVQESTLPALDPKKIEQFKLMVRQNMPEFVAELENKEDLANSTYAMAQEMLLAVMDTLRRYHGFQEQDLKNFHQELEDILKGMKEFETHGLSLLSQHSIGIVGEKVEQSGISGLLSEIAQTRLSKEKMARAGLEYPISLQATPFLRKLKEKNK